MKVDGSHVVCPPIFIATRQRCGGACREKLGDPWVAFFLTKQPPFEVLMPPAAKQDQRDFPSRELQ